MSSNCPPQLELSIQPNTTSFKRSFEQFGFDLESPVVTDAGAPAATSDGRNERSKRARSASSFDSETSSNLSSDTTASTSSSGSSALSEGGAIDTFAVPTSIEPPRLPTPEIQDVEMPDYPAGEPIEVEREGLRGGEQYRLSLGRFNDFDNEIAVLRQPPPTTTTSPPTLPPLRHRLLQDAFFRRIESPGSPFSPTFFEESHPSTSNSDSPQLHTQNPADDAVGSPGPSNPHFDLFRESQPIPSLSLSASNTIPAADPPPTPGFRDRLDSALERLRSPSPLVPGLEDDQDRSDEEDGDEEDDEEEPMAESEAEPETDEHAEGNTIQEHPPTLPPIRTVENFLTGRTMLPALSTTQSPPDPPTLPPIPPISSDVVANATERAWHGRNDLFAERFDDFMRMNRLFTPTPENNPVVAPSPPQSPAADARETAASTSPRPFSRSARSVLSSSRPRNITTNPSLGDHPLPSPILRDLRSWLEERQPSLSNDANFNYSSLHADDASSVSSISTAAATAGTERDASASATASSSATQASSSTASDSSTSHQDRLSRMLDRIRTGRVEDWAGHGIRREWLSPPPPTPSVPAPPVESDSAHTVRDLLPWFTGDPAPASAFGASVPSATPAASRPISTTPAPGNSMLSRSEHLALDSYWEPVFTNLPEANFASASSTQHGTSEQGSSRTTASEDRPSDSAVTTVSRPTSSATHVDATSSPSYFSHIMSHSGDAGRTINPADVSNNNNGDRHINDSAAGMWRPLEPSDLPLSLSFDSTSASSSNTRPQSSFIYTPPNYFDRPPSPSFDPRSISDTSYLYGTSTLNRGTIDTYGSGWASPPNPATNPMAILAREEMRRAVMDRHSSILRRHETLAMREMFDVTENAQQPSSLAPSSLRNWNGRSGEEDGPQSQSQSQPQAPVGQSTSIRTEATSSAVSTRNSETSSSIESRRTDPRLRHRLLRSSSSQMRLGSSNSLVTENASEVRRRADHAEIRRLPGERSSLFGLSMEDRSTDSSSDGTGQSERPRRESSWENVLLQRVWGEGERRRRASVTSERLDPRMPARPSSPSISSIFTSAFTESAALPSLATFVDGLNPATRGAAAGNTDERPRQSQPPTPTSGPPSSPTLDIWGLISAEGNSGGSTDSSQPPRHDAPSLPPPDLGSSFNAGHHSRSMSAPWVSTEDSSADDPMGGPVASANLEPAHIDNANERSNDRPHRNSGLRPLFLSSTMSPGEHQLPEHEPQQSERPHQITSEERARRLQLERRLLEDRRRFASAFRARHPIQRDPLPLRLSAPSNDSTSAVASPTSASTTAPSSSSAMGVSRPSLSQLRRPGDSVGLQTFFDPSTFTPGPFRNTLQHIANEREGQSAARFESNTPRSSLRRPPPYIPPLSFDSENEHSMSSLRQAESIEERTRRRTDLSPTVREGEEMNGPGARRAPRIMRELPFESHSPTRRIPQDDYEPYMSEPRNSSPIVANEATSTNGPHGLRRLSDNWRHSTLNLERYLGEQNRMEASRMSDPRYSFYPPVFPSVIEPLRPDNPGANGLRPAHPIQRYHRDRDLDNRTEDEEDPAPPGESRARRRGRVLRAHQEAVMSFARVSNANMGGPAGWRRGRALGDFMRDEDFDDSYENLLSLSMQIGDVKPRATPNEILEKMEKGVYKDWATDTSDTRCPICLDDYAPTDPVQKLSNCSHWLHRECLTQWLQSATTCPVCRESVNIPPSSPFSASRMPRFPLPPRLNPFANMALPRRRRESSPTSPNPSSPPTQGSNPDGRDTSNRNGGQGTNRPQESPSRSTFPAPWRYRPA